LLAGPCLATKKNELPDVEGGQSEKREEFHKEMGR